MAQPNRRAERESKDRLEPEEFAALFQQAYRSMWLLAAGILGDRVTADDVVQEAAMRAWVKRDEFCRGTNFTAWLGSFVRWNSFNHVRKRTGRGTHPADPSDLDQKVGRPVIRLTDFDHDQRGTIPPDQPHFDDPLMHALLSVSQVGRACLLLRTVHQLSYREIAELLDIPEGTAMSHVHRTRQSLREKLEDQPTTPPGRK